VNNIERRFATLETTITGTKLGGYAAVFNQRTDIAGLYYEEIAPSAFRAALASPELDVRGLLNHDPNYLLARTPNTLRLSTDSHGLLFELDIPDTTVGNDVRAMVEAELITGCSFGFIAGEQEWSVHEGMDLRTHVSVANLLDVSVVTYPAYQGTSVALRSKPTASADGRTRLIRARAQHLPKGIA
ncbi:HK97 family phage prohead protease, partial [Mycolicibacterium sp.]|uniref:HK97 family phage prohead protease n=1 Tax=Mycolicibacterium sp. TaxID=2320850 RepID=UPI00355D9705